MILLYFDMGLSFAEQRRTITILGWPTDEYSGSYSSPAHTVIFFVPGNPGQHDWYRSDLRDILKRLGEGYAIRSVSHAGHGLLGKSNRDKGGTGDSIVDVTDHCRFQSNSDGTRLSPLVPWSVEGQVLHKIAYIDSLIETTPEDKRRSRTNVNRKHQVACRCQFKSDFKFIFIGHSFGCHVIQRICVLRPDILERTSGFLFLMPYIRTKPSFAMDRRKIDFAGSHSELLVAISTKVSRLFPYSLFRIIIREGTQSNSDDENESIANITINLLRNHVYPRNFFELGTEELRDIPNEIDVSTFHLLSSHRTSLFQNTKDSDFCLNTPHKKQRRPIFILHASDNDQWCPSFHGKEIMSLQMSNLFPPFVETTKISGLRHDYVCQKTQLRGRVNNWILSKIFEIEEKVALKINLFDTFKRTNSRVPGILPSKL